MATKWQNFSKEQLEQFVKESQSYADLARLIGYSANSGSTTNAIKTMIQYYNFDTSHFTKQSWNKGNFDYSRFQYGKVIKAANMKDAIIALRGNQCENCGLEEWLNKPIALEVHHKDGDHLNNVLENLELLCPNCHAQTENWRGKNINKKITSRDPITDEKFIEALQNNTSIRQALISLGLTGAGGNYDRAYKLIQQNDIKHLK